VRFFGLGGFRSRKQVSTAATSLSTLRGFRNTHAKSFGSWETQIEDDGPGNLLLYEIERLNTVANTDNRVSCAPKRRTIQIAERNIVFDHENVLVPRRDGGHGDLV
jgi:hypothetical protein